MECAICLADTDEITTWCGHKFHASCLAAALKYRPLCPMCRSLLLPTIEEEDDDDDEFLLIIYHRQRAVVENIIYYLCDSV